MIQCDAAGDIWIVEAFGCTREVERGRFATDIECIEFLLRKLSDDLRREHLGRDWRPGHSHHEAEEVRKRANR